MARLDYHKVAEIRAGKGRYKEAGDYLALANDMRSAEAYYKKALSTTEDISVVQDIRKRIRGKQWSTYFHGEGNEKSHAERDAFEKLLSKAEERCKESFVGGGQLLEQRAYLYLAIIGFASAFLSITLRLTGNVVGSAYNKSNYISLCLFFVGCLFTFFYFRARRKKVY